MTARRTLLAVTVAALLAGAVAVVVAQNDMDKVEIRSEKLAGNVWVLYGAGGNIGLCAGADGAVLIDDEFAPLSAKIQAAVKQVTDQPIRWVVNTHWHGDHVGGNENMAMAGATSAAQDRVRARMIEGMDDKVSGRKVAPAPGRALPILTFNDSTTLHVNGEDIVVFHVAPAHTDGDAIVWFPRANVVHMGDTFFNGFYPIIDLASGGSIDGMIAASARVLPRLADDTKVIPGHGPAADKATLQKYHDMLVGVRAAVANLVKDKKTLEQAVAAKPTAPWDEAWGKGFVKPDAFTTVLYTELSQRKL
jgi:glyoxylase-like metal-dependent hydrolase (beta-lactamase superfamily II)